MNPDQRKWLFSSGMVAVLFYVLHVILGGVLWQGYNHLQQPISDLTATGSPNKALLLFFTTVYGILAIVFAFSFAVFERRNHPKSVFVGAVMLCLLFVVSMSYGLFPEDLPGSSASFTGFMHIAVTALIVPFTILSPVLIGIGFTKEKAWKAFGFYSIASGCLMLVFGSMCGYLFANKLPWFGLVERLNIGVLQVWLFTFSLKLTWK